MNRLTRPVSDPGTLGFRAIATGPIALLPEHDRVTVRTPYRWGDLHHQPGWVPLSEVHRYLPREPRAES